MCVQQLHGFKDLVSLGVKLQCRIRGDVRLVEKVTILRQRLRIR